MHVQCGQMLHQHLQVHQELVHQSGLHQHQTATQSVMLDQTVDAGWCLSGTEWDAPRKDAPGRNFVGA